MKKMNEKKDINYVLGKESIIASDGVTKLFRLVANKTFTNKNAGVIKKGSIGGWVESLLLKNGDARVSGNAWVSGDAHVYGDARVYGNAWVSGDVRVSGNACVYGNAWVYGDAHVYGDACVSGNARVSDDACVSGDARVSGNACVYGKTWVYGDARVYGDACVSGDARVYGDACVSGDVRVSGNACVSVKLCSKFDFEFDYEIDLWLKKEKEFENEKQKLNFEVKNTLKKEGVDERMTIYYKVLDWNLVAKDFLLAHGWRRNDKRSSNHNPFIGLDCITHPLFPLVEDCSMKDGYLRFVKEFYSTAWRTYIAVIKSEELMKE